MSSRERLCCMRQHPVKYQNLQRFVCKRVRPSAWTQCEREGVWAGPAKSNTRRSTILVFAHTSASGANEGSGFESTPTEADQVLGTDESSVGRSIVLAALTRNTDTAVAASQRPTLPQWLCPVKGASEEQTKSLWGVSAMTFCFGASVFMVASLLPVYMKTVLGASQTSIGAVEGLAISCSFWARGLSGIGECQNIGWRKKRKWPVFGFRPAVCSMHDARVSL